MLNELAKEIHENAKAHGFYDDEKDNHPLVKISLIHSELGEATEAYRNEKHSNYSEYNECIDAWKNIDTHNLNFVPFIPIFEKNIKDSFEDELADTIIRVLDLCGYLNIDIKNI